MKELLQVIATKDDIEFRVLQSWWVYESYEQDKLLQKFNWNRKYNWLRPVMWDMANISAYKFTYADLQHLTYSQYYGENCFKRGFSPCSVDAMQQPICG